MKEILIYMYCPIEIAEPGQKAPKPAVKRNQSKCLCSWNVNRHGLGSNTRICSPMHTACLFRSDSVGQSTPKRIAPATNV